MQDVVLYFNYVALSSKRITNNVATLNYCNLFNMKNNYGHTRVDFFLRWPVCFLIVNLQQSILSVTFT